MKRCCAALVSLCAAQAAAWAGDICCVVAEGDSVTYSASGWFYQAGGVPAESVASEYNVQRTYLRAFRAPEQIWANFSLSSSRIQDLEARASQLDALINRDYAPVNGRPARHYILCLLVGTNPSDPNPVAAAGRVRQYCLARQAAGWRVLLGTLPSRTDGILGNFDTAYAQPMNEIFRGWGEEDGVAGIIDFAADPEIGATGAANSAVYFDSIHVHPTAAGAALMAARARKAIDELIGKELDREGPAGGTLELSPGLAVDRNAVLTARLADWTDVNLPLSYELWLDGELVSARGPDASRPFPAAEPGEHQLQVRIYDGRGNATEVCRAFTVNSCLESWRRDHFGSICGDGDAADLADPDRDSVVNLLEFAFGTDPGIHGPAPLDYCGSFCGPCGITRMGQPTLRAECRPEGTEVRALYLCRKGAGAGLIYEPQFSSDLRNWQPCPGSPVVLADDGTFEMRSVAYPPCSGPGSARFFRVQVSRSP